MVAPVVMAVMDEGHHSSRGGLSSNIYTFSANHTRLTFHPRLLEVRKGVTGSESMCGGDSLSAWSPCSYECDFFRCRLCIHLESFYLTRGVRGNESSKATSSSSSVTSKSGIMKFSCDLEAGSLVVL